MDWMKNVFTVVLLTVLVHRLTKFMIALGVHRPMYNHTPGPFHLVPGVVNGSEDIATTSYGLAFISSGLTTMINNEEGVKGKILTFDFHQPDSHAREVEMVGDSMPDDLNPLGLDVWEEKGRLTLFVVNRDFDSGNSAIEVFDFDKSMHTLIHKKTIKHPNIYCPNGIVAINEGAFYVTNDGFFNNPILRMLEIVLLLPTGNIVYYDGVGAVNVASGFGMANGIDVSPNNEYIYVASTFEQHIRVYEVKSATQLNLLMAIPLATLVDNISVQPDTGDLWIGGNVNGYKFMFDEGRGKGTAQVLWIRFTGNRDYEMREVLMDDGNILKGSSVASFYNGHMLVGTANGKLLLCDIRAF